MAFTKENSLIEKQDSVKKETITISKLIAKKRDKERLSKDEIEAFIKELVQGKVEKSQLGMY